MYIGQDEQYLVPHIVLWAMSMLDRVLCCGWVGSGFSQGGVRTLRKYQLLGKFASEEAVASQWLYM